MRVVIVGLGYAGKRYHRAFSCLAGRMGLDLDLAYVGRRQRSDVIPYFADVPRALEAFRPDVVVVSVNDQSHIDILRDLAGFEGFVICEKPLAAVGDDWRHACAGLTQVKGFALDLVERYSDATRRLKEAVIQRGWRLVRASFHWGKDRLNDYRPTCGVTSEVIHALDLVEWIGASDEPLRLRQAIGVRSDFSISGDEVMDTVMLTASLGDASVAGYSSFVNIQRQRTVDFSFADPDGRIFHARIVYDTPAWDHDHLRIWTRGEDGREVVVDELSAVHQSAGQETIHKLSLLCEDALRVAVLDEPPQQPFADLQDAARLQILLDAISEQVAIEPSTARYTRGKSRLLIPENADLESLG